MDMHTLDGSMEFQTKELKKFFGLSEEQTFQDLDVDVNETEPTVNIKEH